MRILYLADIRFPLERANGIQTAETCYALAERGHAVTLGVRPDVRRPARDPFDFYGLPRIDRLAIARAFLRDAPIVILDEPTSALDAESEELIKQALRRLLEGRTALIIAHRLSTIQHAHRVIVLEEGRIIEQGRHDELLRRPNGLYRRYAERQLTTHLTT